jgi:hypothetical protein
MRFPEAYEGLDASRVLFYPEDGDLKVNQLKVFKGPTEVIEEEGLYKEIILA